MERTCQTCGRLFNPNEVCSKCARLYSSSICLSCCGERGICSEQNGSPAQGQGLLTLLEKQYHRKTEEMTLFTVLIQKARDPLIKLCLDKMAFDVARHSSVLDSLITLMKTNMNVRIHNAGISLEEMDRLMKKRKESRDTYRESLQLAGSDEVKLLIKDLLLDEDQHCQLISELWSLLFDAIVRNRRVGS